MKTYEITHLETDKVLSTVEADGFIVDEGVVLFYKDADTFKTGRINVAITQISVSTLIVEKKTPKPALVVPFQEEECTNQS